MLEYSEKITIWQDQEIPPGANWEDQINTHLNDADIILLLVSASFISSKYCWNREVQVALERHKAGTARVIPIILRPALWKDTPLGQLQALPTGAKPVVQWDDQDIAFDNVAQGIREMVKDLLRTLETDTHTFDLQTAASRVHLAVSSPQEALQTGQPLLRKWLVRGGIMVLVVLLLSTGGVWLSHRSSPTTTDPNQRPTLTNTAAATPRQEHSIGVITEYLIPTPDAQADSITLGSDGPRHTQ